MKTKVGRTFADPDSGWLALLDCRRQVVAGASLARRLPCVPAAHLLERVARVPAGLILT
jgi:hypothetical protein